MEQPKKLILVLLASALAFCSQADNSTWRNTVDNYIAQGEFIKAESVIQSLPKKD
jgi:outer membrane protein assembly factor BamE (lipoprotein component of BamABCDE complex)